MTPCQTMAQGFAMLFSPSTALCNGPYRAWFLVKFVGAGFLIPGVLVVPRMPQSAGGVIAKVPSI